MIEWLERLIRAVLRIPADAWIGLSFVPITALFVIALYRADRSEESAFKLVHFVTSDTGRGSHVALGYTMLVVVCAWGLWALIVQRLLTEWYLYGIIGGFILGGAVNKFANVKAKLGGIPDADPAAGDNTDTPPAAVARKTTLHEETTEHIPQQPAARESPLAPKARKDK